MTVQQPLLPAGPRRGWLSVRTTRQWLPAAHVVGVDSGPTGFPSRPTRLGARWRPGRGRF